MEIVGFCTVVLFLAFGDAGRGIGDLIGEVWMGVVFSFGAVLSHRVSGRGAMVVSQWVEMAVLNVVLW